MRKACSTSAHVHIFWTVSFFFGVLIITGLSIVIKVYAWFVRTAISHKLFVNWGLYILHRLCKLAPQHMI